MWDRDLPPADGQRIHLVTMTVASESFPANAEDENLWPYSISPSGALIHHSPTVFLDEARLRLFFERQAQTLGHIYIPLQAGDEGPVELPGLLRALGTVAQALRHAELKGSPVKVSLTIESRR